MLIYSRNKTPKDGNKDRDEQELRRPPLLWWAISTVSTKMISPVPPLLLWLQERLRAQWFAAHENEKMGQGVPSLSWHTQVDDLHFKNTVQLKPPPVTVEYTSINISLYIANKRNEYAPSLEVFTAGLDGALANLGGIPVCGRGLELDDV